MRWLNRYLMSGNFRAQKVFISVAVLWMLMTCVWKVRVGKEETAQENPDLKVKNVRREVYCRRIGFA